MRAVCCVEGDYAAIPRYRRGSGRLSQQARPLSLVLAACAFVACAHTSDPRYLSADEIQSFVIGNSLTETDSGRWKEDYLFVDENRREGIVRGHQKPPDGPYSGTWSIAGNAMCLAYLDFPDQGGCYRFARERGNKILWINGAGEVAFNTRLVERDAQDYVTVDLVLPAFRHETITFQSGGNTLVGELSLPTGSAPFPAVVFVHGSGPATRHQTYLELIRDEFLHRGFATLIWSKPGVDESTGQYLKQTIAMRAEEVAAAMTHLAARADIDADRIGLWGGSQAGWVIPMVPALRSVAFVIAVACPAQSGTEQMLFSVGNELAIAGISADGRADVLGHIRTLHKILRTATDYEAYLRDHEEWLAEAAQRYWYSAVKSQIGEKPMLKLYFTPMDRGLFEFVSTPFDNGEPPRLNDLHMPVLAIYGSKDAVIDSKIGSNAYETIPRINGNPDVTVTTFEGADHGIMVPNSEGYLEFAPGYLTLMGEWLAAHH